jgi:hypothetical protein
MTGVTSSNIALLNRRPSGYLLPYGSLDFDADRFGVAVHRESAISFRYFTLPLIQAMKGSVGKTRS